MAAQMSDDPEVQKQLQLMQEIEIEMMSDMYNRLTKACYKKCIPPAYKDSEVAKGEAVCIDRCVAKYLDIHDKVGKKLQQITLQDTQKLLQK